MLPTKLYNTDLIKSDIFIIEISLNKSFNYYYKLVLN